jgi:hypothetical protein
VEIYKVEVSNVNPAYTFVQPPYGEAEEGKVQGSSRDVLSIGSEFFLQSIENVYQGAGYRMRLLSTVFAYDQRISKTACSKVTESTSFNDIKIDLASIYGGGWYEAMKYLSDHDMAKLGVRLMTIASEAANSW